MESMRALTLLLIAQCVEQSGGNDAMEGKVELHLGLGGQNCHSESRRWKITCTDIPRTVPDGVTDVTVTRHHGEIQPGTFLHGWKHVRRLDIVGPDVTKLPSRTFCNLTQLRELTMNSYRLYYFNNESFQGLENLRRMTILDQLRIIENMTNAIAAKGMLPNLEELTINPGPLNKAPEVKLTDDFVHALLEKPLVMLNMSNVWWFANKISTIKLMLKVDVLNVTGSTIIFLPFDTLQSVFTESIGNESKALLEVLDVSRTKQLPIQHILGHDRNNGSNTGTNLERSFRFASLFRNVVNLYMDELPDKRGIFVNADDSNMTDRHVWIRRLYIRGNGTVGFNSLQCNLTLPKDNTFELMDLSKNGMFLLSPGVIATAAHLKEIYLSENKLSKMESSQFEILFFPHKELKILDLSSNDITAIPQKMFENNHNLRLLKLSHNKINSVDFNLSGLAMLSVIDLSYNDIHVIEDGSLERIEQYMNMHYSVKLLLTGNPIKCVCDNLKFVEWLASYLKSRDFASNTERCKYGGSNIEINEQAVSKVKFLCIRNVVIAVSTLVSVLAISITVAVSMYIYKRIQQRQMVNFENYFKDEIISGRSQFSYLVFVAYASVDEHIVCPVLELKLKPTLKEILETDKDLVSTGDNFRPGFPIAEETFETIQASCVFIAIISEAFLQSNYCLAEFREACTQQRPIILISNGHVSEEDMTPYMKRLFRQNTRGALRRRDDGVYEFIPGTKELCDSIWAHAVDDAKQNGHFLN